ncbi:MAG: oligosaccharide flippase family protein [Bacteroidetes bacterium]|nr:oligosaccharide flippase family protein [Bacteroidota bacterium]
MIRPFSQRSEFLRHTTQLLVGTSLAQGLVFVIQPVLSRLFTTSDYAVYGVFITLLSWLEIISTGRYELATVIPKHDRDAINLVAGTSLLSTIIAILTFVVVIFFGQTISSLLKLPALLPYLYLLPFTLLIWSIAKMLNSWLVRKESFKASSVNKIVQKCGEQGSSVTFGFFSFHGGLIIGDFIGRAMMLIVSIRQSINAGAGKSMLSWNESLGIMKQFYRYPFYNTIPALLNTTATLLPVFYMTSKYPGDPAGNFIFSRMVLMAPISFLAFSISQALLQKVAKNRINNLSIKTEILFLLKYLGLIGLGLIIIFLAAGPSIFEFVFGKRWLLAGTFSQIMAISYATQFLVSPISSALAAMEKIKLYSLWQAGYFLAIGCLFFVKEIPVKDFILLLTSIEVLFYLVYLILILWVVRKYEHSISTIPGDKL